MKNWKYEFIKLTLWLLLVYSPKVIAIPSCESFFNLLKSPFHSKALGVLESNMKDIPGFKEWKQGMEFLKKAEVAEDSVSSEESYYAQARFYFEQSVKANKAYPLGRIELGEMYMKGRGVPKDFNKAREWLMPIVRSNKSPKNRRARQMLEKMNKLEEEQYQETVRAELKEQVESKVSRRVTEKELKAIEGLFQKIPITGKLGELGYHLLSKIERNDEVLHQAGFSDVEVGILMAEAYKVREFDEAVKVIIRKIKARPELRELVERALSKTVTIKELKVIERIFRKEQITGKLASSGVYYGLSQIKKYDKILRKAGFSKKEIGKLLIEAFSPIEGKHKSVKNFLLEKMNKLEKEQYQAKERAELKELVELELSRAVTIKELTAIEGIFQKIPITGRLGELEYHTLSEIKKNDETLSQAGFSDAEIGKLMEEVYKVRRYDEAVKNFIGKIKSRSDLRQ